METFTCSIMLVVLVLKISKAIKLSFFFQFSGNENVCS